MLNLNDLSLFVQIVDHGGFAPAGRALGIPKSTLSKRLIELERETGARLVQRSSRHFTVTELGQEVYRHATAMLIEAEAAENVIRGRLAEPSGTVRITAAVPIAQEKLATVMPQLAFAYPKISLVLHATDRFVDIVQEGFDIAVRAHRAPLPDSDLVQRRIGFEPNWLVAAPAFLARNGSPDSPSDLDGADGIVVSPAELRWTLADDSGTRIPVSPRPRYFADESRLLIEAAKAGLGVTCLPSLFCTDALLSGELVRVLPGWTAGGIATTLLVPHRRGQLPAVKAVADALVRALSTDG